jgi:hypothetical protein
MPGDPGIPNRNTFIEPGFDGDRLLLTGAVLTRSAVPMVDVRLEFWQADTAGKYHMAENKLRGRQRTKPDGRFALETFVPGYTGKMRRINFIAEAAIPGRKQLLLLGAAIVLATEQELNTPVRDADRPYVKPNARIYRDDPAFLSLDKLPLINGSKQVTYDIVFDIE